MSKKTHWIVVSSHKGPSGRPVQHSDEHLAEMEARRLALKHPEDSFTVYRAVLVAEVPRVVVTRLEEGDDEPPF